MHPQRSVLLMLSLALGLGAFGAWAEAVEEVVDLDALDEPAHDAKVKKSLQPGEHTQLPPSALSQTGKVVEEVVDLDAIDAVEAVGVPEYDRRGWLGMLPLLPLLILMWNVDWREARVNGEVSSARARLAPKKKSAPPTPVKSA